MPARAILFTVEAWDVNCRKHIPQRFGTAEIAPVFARLQARIAALEAALAAAQAQGAEEQRPVQGEHHGR